MSCHQGRETTDGCQAWRSLDFSGIFFCVQTADMKKCMFCSKEIGFLLAGKLVEHQLCPVLINTLIPYFISLRGGATFTWSRDLDGVLVRCPEVEGGLVVNIKRVSRKCDVFFIIEATNGHCPFYKKKGVQVNLESFFKEVCPVVFRLAISALLFQKNMGYVQNGTGKDLKGANVSLTALRCPLEQCDR